MIPTSINLKYQVSGSIVRVCECDHCGTKYGYVYESMGWCDAKHTLLNDSAKARTQAVLQAKTMLRRSLTRDVNLAPCPTCGRYQQKAISQLKESHVGGTGILDSWIPWLFFAIFGVPLNLAFGAYFLPDVKNTPAVPWGIYAALVSAFALVSACELYARRRRKRKFDPNNDHDVAQRLASPSTVAVTGAQLEELIRSRGLEMQINVPVDETDERDKVDDASEPMTCLACGFVMDRGCNICPKCGWSYAE